MYRCQDARDFLPFFSLSRSCVSLFIHFRIVKNINTTTADSPRIDKNASDRKRLAKLRRQREADTVSIYRRRVLLFEQRRKKKELGVILDAKSRYEIAREALRRAEEICKRGRTRNTEIFKTVRMKKKCLNELFSSGGKGAEEDVNVENDDDEEKEFVVKVSRVLAKISFSTF